MNKIFDMNKFRKGSVISVFKGIKRPSTLLAPVSDFLFGKSISTNDKKDIEIAPNMHFFKPLPVRLEFSTSNPPLSTKTLESIDVSIGYHRQAGILAFSSITLDTFSDKIAYGLVKFLRVFADLFFQKRYVHRAIVLETVAAVPGMVAAMVRHMRSLRRMVSLISSYC